MANEIKIGKLGYLTLSYLPSAIMGAAILWVVLNLIGVALFQLTVPKAIIGALVAVILHYLSEIVHQLGHAYAAQRTGHPMTGIRLWGLLSSSLYPPDEPALPARVHITRALGGPIMSLLVTIFAAVLVAAYPGTPGTIWLVLLFFFLDNLLTFTLGAFLPLGFTDGSTLLHWLRAGQAEVTP
jgi:mannose/fructose/N-acetylgalactosamine-specific phosphotransferase system component IID